MPLQVVDQISKKRKRHAYDASFKIRVATYAIENGNNSKAAREFDVSEKQVRDWKKNLPSLNELIWMLETSIMTISWQTLTSKHCLLSLMILTLRGSSEH